MNYNCHRVDPSPVPGVRKWERNHLTLSFWSISLWKWIYIPHGFHSHQSVRGRVGGRSIRFTVHGQPASILPATENTPEKHIFPRGIMSNDQGSSLITCSKRSAVILHRKQVPPSLNLSHVVGKCFPTRHTRLKLLTALRTWSWEMWSLCTSFDEFLFACVWYLCLITNH